MTTDQFLKAVYNTLYDANLTNLGKVNKIKDLDFKRWQASGDEFLKTLSEGN